MLFDINTRDRQVISKVHKKQGKVIWRESSIEMNNHADPHGIGANFRPISFTLEECTVSTFLSECADQLNMMICIGVTALTIRSGEVEIIEFGKDL